MIRISPDDLIGNSVLDSLKSLKSRCKIVIISSFIASSISGFIAFVAFICDRYLTGALLMVIVALSLLMAFHSLRNHKRYKHMISMMEYSGKRY